MTNSERYTSGAKSAWKADFHPDVTRPETGSGENGDWMRKMEIGGGERGPEGLQRVSEVARAGGLACWRGPRGLAGWREQRELASRWEGPVGRQAAALDVRRGYARLCEAMRGYARLAFPVEADVGVLWGDAVGEGWELHVVAVVLAKHFVVAGPAFELAAFKFEGRDSEKAFVFPIFVLGSAAKH